MNPNPDQVASIKTFVAANGGWTLSDPQIRAKMTAATVANPLARGNIPKPFTMSQVLGLLSSASLANLKTFAGIEGLRSDVNTNNVAACVEWCSFLAGSAVIAAAEATGILAVVQATEPDPSWTPTVAWDLGTLGRPCDDFDLEQARHN